MNMNMTYLKKTAALAVLCALSAPALAESVDVKVAGKITPPACTPSLGGGGVVDYGTIKVSSLSPTDYTVLETKDVAFSITCKVATKVALNAINGRPGTLAGAAESGPDKVGPAPVTLFGATTPRPSVGLGLDASGNKIGGYAMNLYTVLLDGSATSTNRVVSTDNGATWTGDVGRFYNSTSDQLLSWGTPSSFTTMSATLSVQAYLNKSTELNLSKPVNLDGLTTLEMVYL